MDEISFMGSHAGGRCVGRKHHMHLHLHLLPAPLPADGTRVHSIKGLRAGIALACGVLLSSSTLAAELGDITLSSALNEPLAAAIELEGLGGVSVADISVTLGDEAAYEQAGIERDPVLDDVTVTIESTTADEGRILLASARAVSEPFLNLIVAVTEPDGTTAQKEYTLLLELPGNDPATQTATATPPAATTQPQPAAAAGNAQGYQVGPGDTLWEIAANTRPDSSVTVQQMMLAIQRANPDAFLNGNINTLLSGRVLRIPSQQDIAAIDRQAAVAQVSQQNTALGGQPLAGDNTGGAGGGADARDQLRLLSGDAAAEAGNGGGDLAATIAALENELMLSEESLDRARLQNAELNSRLAALQEQIDLLENIIAMEDDRIATLQAELVRQAEATAQALASAENTAAAIEELNNQPPAGPAGLLRNGIVLLGVLVLVVLAALGLLVHRRRQAQLAAEENRFNPAFADDVDDEPVAVDEKPGLLAGLLARFRRNRDEDDLDEDDDYEADAAIAERHEPAAAAAAAYAATSDSTDRLRNEMGLDDDVTASLGDALDRIDNEQSEMPLDAFEPAADDAPVVAEADDDVSFAIDAVEAAAAEEQTRDDDYALTVADAAFAAADADAEEEATVAATDDDVAAVDRTPAVATAADDVEAETIEFTMPAAEPEPDDVSADVAAIEDDIPETFEFTLKDLPDIESPVSAVDDSGDEIGGASGQAIETFDFRLSTPAPAPAPEPAAVETAESLEVIAFPGQASTSAAAPVAIEDLPLELGDISFDDTTLIDDEDDGPFKPRSGNECDTKLDLATAYEAMGDVVEAIEILDEVIAEGSPAQVETAQRLKDSWQTSL